MIVGAGEAPITPYIIALFSAGPGFFRGQMENPRKGVETL